MSRSGGRSVAGSTRSRAAAPTAPAAPDVRKCLTASRLDASLHEKFLIGSGLTLLDELAVCDIDDLMDLLIDLGLPRIKAKATAKLMVRAVDELPVEELAPIAEIVAEAPRKATPQKKKKKGESDAFDVQCVGVAVAGKKKKKKKRGGGGGVLEIGGAGVAPFGAPHARSMHPAQLAMLQSHQLLVAVSGNDEAAVEHLLRRGVSPHVATLADPVDRSIEAGWNALHIAACMGFIEVAHLLLAYGADPNVRQLHSRTEPGFTPLYIATRNGHLALMKLLIARGADPCVANDGGTAPIHVACEAGSVDAVRLLLEHGADPFATDGAGRGAEQIATAYADTAVLQVLQAAPQGGDDPLRASRYIASTMGAHASGLDAIEMLLGHAPSGPDPRAQSQTSESWRTQIGDPRGRLGAVPATRAAVLAMNGGHAQPPVRGDRGIYPQHASEPLPAFVPRTQRTTRSIDAILDSALGAAGPRMAESRMRGGSGAAQRSGMARAGMGVLAQGPAGKAVRHDIYSAPWPLPRTQQP